MEPAEDSPEDTKVIALHGPDTVRQAQALRRLIETYDGRLHRYLARKVPDAEIEDAVQEVYGRLSRVLAADPGAQLLSSYVFKTADNISRDQFRRRRVRQQDQHVELPENLTQSEPSPLEHLHWRQNLSAVKAALNRLPPVQRRILLLHRLEGMSLPEVSAELDMPLRTVERNLSRALGACRTELEEAGWFGRL